MYQIVLYHAVLHCIMLLGHRPLRRRAAGRPRSLLRERPEHRRGYYYLYVLILVLVLVLVLVLILLLL